MRRLLAPAALTTVLALGAATAAPAAAAAPPATAAAPQAVIRVDQVGYATGEAKRGYLLATRATAGAPFTVRDTRGRTVLTGRVGPSAGAWNARYGAVHPIDLSPLRTPGTYTVRAGGAVSPQFRVAAAAELFGPLTRDAVSFFTVQRDGAAVVPGPLHRRPSHLTDRRATVYDVPNFTGDGGDVLAERPTPIGGPVDVEGGWFDAGDYVKFAHTTAYSVAALLLAERAGGSGIGAEAEHGLRWLDKMWDAGRGVLYVQVGIGTGSEELGLLGDHDVWRLPEADDALVTGPGDESYFLKYRPVFVGGPAGGPVSPNLAGRLAAAFALGAQAAARRGDRTAARHWLGEAASLFARARTTDVGELVTAYPHAYYPEDSWADDLEYGAVELERAARVLGDPRADGWLRDATHWAAVYLGSGSRDTLNLYDTSAIAHAELITALRAARLDGEVTERQLVADLRRQLDAGVEAAAGNLLGHAADVADFDAASRSFGFAATARLYRTVTGDRLYDAFGTAQRDFAFGVNGWGVSLMIGAGADFAHCPQHQVANLSGSLTGGRPVIRGAVVIGPNGADNFTDIGIPDGARSCPAGGGNRFAAFDRTDARFLDDVRAWPSVEPAIDFTATAALALSLTAAG
ncbi:glycoside hydrolase family 9 protein [Dactylosporangium fulvum]|uniref:glycoside hydrolase family 9 protein n=1 Tax=Dactylosporangium fulvum TaxID=53359 RepID=UPI0031DFD5B6